MFKKKTPSEGDYNYLSHSTSINADLDCENIIIHGKVRGSVTAKYKVTVGREAVVEGKIIAKRAIIFGRVLGDLQVSSELQIKSSGLVSGDIEAGSISVEMGAVLNGFCVSYSQELNPNYFFKLFSKTVDPSEENDLQNQKQDSKDKFDEGQSNAKDIPNVPLNHWHNSIDETDKIKTDGNKKEETKSITSAKFDHREIDSVDKFNSQVNYWHNPFNEDRTDKIKTDENKKEETKSVTSFNIFSGIKKKLNLSAKISKENNTSPDIKKEPIITTEDSDTPSFW